MKYFKILILFFFIQLNHLYSQNLKIQEIKFANSILQKEIINFIDKRKKEYPKFKDIGYIKVTLNYYKDNAKQKELSYIYSFKDQYITLNNNSNYPLFFTYINNKIVLLYTNKFNDDNKINLSKKSKKKLAKKIKKSLGKTERLVVFNSKGEKIIDDKNFNPNESFNIHGGVELKIYADNSVKITNTNHNTVYKK